MDIAARFVLISFLILGWGCAGESDGDDNPNAGADANGGADVDVLSDVGDTSSNSSGILKTLVAESGGQEIGVILEMDPYSLRIWDREHDLLFTLNQVTGNVCGDPPNDVPQSNQLFGDSNCSRDPIGVSRVDDRCPGSPVRREAWGLDNDRAGASRATAILAYSGAPTEQVWRLRGVNLDVGVETETCESTVIPGLCFLPTGQTSEIPTHFSLPIEVVER